uniref:Uncharacterized protein n=1 Tax=Sphaerodactylus townsendi TaxID=933632 RepID=A0ACB8FBI1_9SAUR
MSEDRIASGIDPAEEGSETDKEQHSDGCFQGLCCCCVPRRRMSLPGKKPKDRKKKHSAGGLSFSDIMLEEEMDQICWNVSIGDQESVQIEAIKSTQPLCPQAYGTKDDCIRLPIGTFCLEEKQKDYDEKSSVKSFQEQAEAAKPSQEWLNDLSVLCSDKEDKRMAAVVSEGLPFENETSYQVMPSQEKRQAGRSESLGSLLQEVAREKEQQEGGDHASVISEGVSCKKVCEKQEQQATPFQELEQHGKQEDLKSPSLDPEIKMQEEQNNRTDDEDVTSLKELLVQSWVPYSEEQQTLGQQQPAKDAAHQVEEQATWDKVNAVPKGDTNEKVQGSPLYPEEWQPVELKYLDSSPVVDTKHGQEQSEALHRVKIVSETSHNEAEHEQPADQEVQQPFIVETTRSSFQDTFCEKDRELVQCTASSVSDSPLSKTEEHQGIPCQVNIQTVVQENKTTFQPDVPWATEQQKRDDVCEKGLGYAAEQKNLQKQHILLGELTSSPHLHRISHEKEPEEGPDHSYFGSQGIASPEEQENSWVIISETAGTLPDNVSFEKEQQRKLESGDSGSDGLYDKEEQDCQAALYLEGQPPLGLEQLCSVPLNRSSEAEQGARNGGTLETHWQEEQAAEYGDQSKKFHSVFSKEKEAKEDQDELETTIFSSTQQNVQEEEMVSGRAPNNTFTPLKDQPQRDPFDLGLTCEGPQRKEKQDLSESRFSRSTRTDEEDM